MTPGLTTASASGAARMPILAMTPIGQVRLLAGAPTRAVARRGPTCATPRLAVRPTRPRRSRRSRHGERVVQCGRLRFPGIRRRPLRDQLRVRAARRTATARAYSGDGQRDAGYGAGRDTYQGAGYGRSGSGSGSAAMAGTAGRATARVVRETTPATVAALGYAGANGRSGGAGYSPEFMPVDNDDVDDEPPAGTPRPYGRLSIYTLHDDKTREFDRLAERAAEGVRASEPDTLVYVIHVVPKAPMQRIIYEIYRDRGAFLSHERQPHIRQFAADRASCVLATNIIDLRLKYAKVAALGSAPEAAAQPQASWTPRAAEAAPGNDRYAATTQYCAGPVLIRPVLAGPVLAGPVLVQRRRRRTRGGGELHAGEGPVRCRQ